LPSDVAPIIKPPPPKFPFSGQVTASVKPIATAASIAFPPFYRIATPASEACTFVETTIPFSPKTGFGEAAYKELITVIRSNIYIFIKLKY